MVIMLAAGEAHHNLFPFLSKTLNIINDDPVMPFDFSEEHWDYLSCYLVLDDCGTLSVEEKLKRLGLAYEGIIGKKRSEQMCLITTDFSFYLCLRAMYEDKIQLHWCKESPSTTYIEERLNLKKGRRSRAAATPKKAAPDAPVKETPVEGESKREKKNILGLFARKKENPSTTEAVFSRSVNRTVLITGTRNSGITSTVVNMAECYAEKGFKTIVVDLDWKMRGMNAYFNSFHEATVDSEEMAASLIRVLASPGEHRVYGHNIDKNLWVTSLGYQFEDSTLEGRFITCDHIISMLTLLKQQFNVVIIDAPLDILQQLSDIIGHLDTIGLCMENNLHSVLSTIRHLDVAFDIHKVKYINAKGKLILNRFDPASKYDGDQFSGETASALMASGISEAIVYRMPVAGTIPQSALFHQQIETDMPVVTVDNAIKEVFDSLILRMIEGA